MDVLHIFTHKPGSWFVVATFLPLASFLISPPSGGRESLVMPARSNARRFPHTAKL